MADATQLSSLSDETQKGARSWFWQKQSMGYEDGPIIAGSAVYPFSAQTECQELTSVGAQSEKAPRSIISFVSSQGGIEPPDLEKLLGPFRNPVGLLWLLLIAIACLGLFI